MNSEDNDQPTNNEIRRTFCAMIRRIELTVEEIPDWLVREAKLIHLKILLSHSEKIEDSEKLADYCLAALAKMKCSVDDARLINRPIGGPQSDDAVDLRAIMYAALHD